MTPESFDEWLSSSGTTLRQAAELSGVDKSKLSRYRHGKATLTRPENLALEQVAGARSRSPTPPPSPSPTSPSADPIATALASAADMMQVLVDVARDPGASPQVRVAAAARVLAYSPGRPGPLKDAPAEGVSEEAQARLAAWLRKMASGIDMASAIPIPDPPAPVTSQDPTPEPEPETEE